MMAMMIMFFLLQSLESRTFVTLKHAQHYIKRKELGDPHTRKGLQIKRYTVLLNTPVAWKTSNHNIL